MSIKFLGMCVFLFCMQAAFAQTDKINSEQIIVKVFESGPLSSSMILVSYGNEQIESVDLKSLSNTKNWQSNLLILHTVLDRVRKQGYSLINSTGVGGDALFTTTYIFLRDDLVQKGKSID